VVQETTDVTAIHHAIEDQRPEISAALLGLHGSQVISVWYSGLSLPENVFSDTTTEDLETSDVARTEKHVIPA